MSGEVLVGVIALSGTLVGAAAAFAGVVYQQKQQAKLLGAERREALAHQAVDTLVAELEKVRELAASVPYRGENPPDFSEILDRHVSVIELAALRLPDKDLREAIQAACILGFGHTESFQAHVGLRTQQVTTSVAQRVVMTAMCWDVQKCLGAYLRQEHRPETTYLFQARDYHQSMLNAARVAGWGDGT